MQKKFKPCAGCKNKAACTKAKKCLGKKPANRDGLAGAVSGY